MKELFKAVNFDKNTKGNLLVIVLLYAPFLLMALYNTPQTDDITIEYMVHKSGGIWSFQNGLYWEWSPLFTTNFLLSLYSLTVFGNIGAVFISVLIFLLYCYVPYTALVKFGVSGKDALAIVTIFLCVTIYTFVDIGELFYWITGSLAYTYGFIFSILSLIVYTKLTKKFNLWTVLFFFLVLASCGSNTLTWVTTVLCWYFFIGMKFLRTKKLTAFEVQLLLLLFLVSIFIFFSPANQLRSIQEYSRRGIDITNESGAMAVGRLKHSFMQTLDYTAFMYFPTWFSSFFVVATAFLIPTLSKLGEKVTNPIRPLILLSFTLFALLVLIFMPFFGTGGIPANRTVDIAFIYFYIGILGNMVNYFAYHKIYEVRGMAQLKKILVFSMLLFVLIFPNNIKSAYSDVISGKFFTVMERVELRNRTVSPEADVREFVEIEDGTKLKLYQDIVHEDSLQKVAYQRYFSIVND